MDRAVSRRAFVATAGVVVLAGCTSRATPNEDAQTTVQETTVDEVDGWVLERGDCGDLYKEPVTIEFRDPENGTVDVEYTVRFGTRFLPDLEEGEQYNLHVADDTDERTELGLYEYNGRTDVNLIVSGCTAS